MLIEFTPEEQKRLREMQEPFVQERERIGALIKDAADEEERKRLYTQLRASYDSIIEDINAYIDTCQRERFARIRRGGVSAIIAHAKEQCPLMLERMHKELVQDAEGLPQEDLAFLGVGSVKKGQLYINADYATKWLKDELRLHIEAVRDDKDTLKRLLSVIIEAVDRSPLTEKTPEDEHAKAADQEQFIRRMPLSVAPSSAILKANMPMYHGKATDALAALSSRNIKVNPLADRAEIQAPKGNYKITIQDFSKLKGKLSVNTHKLLMAGIAEFTQANNYGGGTIKPQITIPFEEYARLIGYEIDERPTETPEAAAKEKQRAKENRKKAMQRIRQDLELLQAQRWKWEEKVRGKSADFDSILLLERVAIRNGYIIMEFGRNMAEYLKQLPLTQYPQSLLTIDARSDNAYRMGLKMAEHFSIDANQIKGTADRLKVSTLLEVTQLPTMEMLQQEKPDDSRHWDRRIKDPFEAALDVLTGKVISNWEYVKPKGEPLTDEEAYNITDYNTFASLLVQFELLEAPEQEDRRARRAEEKKAAAAREAAKEKRRKRNEKQ